MVCLDKRVLLVTEETKVDLDLQDLLDFQEKTDLRARQDNTEFRAKQGSQAIPAYLVTLGCEEALDRVVQTENLVRLVIVDQGEQWEEQETLVSREEQEQWEWLEKRATAVNLVSRARLENQA